MARAMPKFTKSPPELLASFDAAMPGDPRVVRKTMFGCPAYFLNGNMFAFTFGPRVAVRVDGTRRSKTGTGAAVFEIMPGRPMKDYVEVPVSATKGVALRRWIAEGLAAAEGLPSKATKKAPTSKTKRAR